MQGSGISDRPFLSYQESVHAEAIARETPARPSALIVITVTTFSPHRIRSHQLPRSKSLRPAESATKGKRIHSECSRVSCGTGRVARARMYRCHGIHNIKMPSDQMTATATNAVATESCTKCHEGVALTRNSASRVGASALEDGYHGLASPRFKDSCQLCKLSWGTQHSALL